MQRGRGVVSFGDASWDEMVEAVRGYMRAWCRRLCASPPSPRSIVAAYRAAACTHERARAVRPALRTRTRLFNSLLSQAQPRAPRLIMIPEQLKDRSAHAHGGPRRRVLFRGGGGGGRFVAYF